MWAKGSPISECGSSTSHRRRLCDCVCVCIVLTFLPLPWQTEVTYADQWRATLVGSSWGSHEMSESRGMQAARWLDGWLGRFPPRLYCVYDVFHVSPRTFTEGQKVVDLVFSPQLEYSSDVSSHMGDLDKLLATRLLRTFTSYWWDQLHTKFEHL